LRFISACLIQVIFNCVINNKSWAAGSNPWFVQTFFILANFFLLFVFFAREFKTGRSTHVLTRPDLVQYTLKFNNFYVVLIGFEWQEKAHTYFEIPQANHNFFKVLAKTNMVKIFCEKNSNHLLSLFGLEDFKYW
jgi:hypothetical protein